MGIGDEMVKLTNMYHINRLYTERHSHKLHMHKQELELLYVYGGEGIYHVGNRAYAVRPGDMVVCNANTLHGETMAFQNTMETYCCALTGVETEGSKANCLLRPEVRPVIPLKQFDDAIHALLPEIFRLFQKGEEDRTLADRLALGILDMVRYEIRTKKEDIQTGQIQKKEDLVRRITEYIDSRMTEELTVEEIASVMHVSSSYLYHLYKKETGMSPKQYIMLRRIGEAQSLLENPSLTIGEIEERLGFGSHVHFSAAFRKYVGISPTEYRKGRRTECEAE